MNKYSNLFILPVCSVILLIMWGSFEPEGLRVLLQTKSFWTNQDDATGVLTHSYVQLRSMSCGELFTLGESRSDVITRQSQGISMSGIIKIR